MFDQQVASSLSFVDYRFAGNEDLVGTRCPYSEVLEGFRVAD